MNELDDVWQHDVWRPSVTDSWAGSADGAAWGTILGRPDAVAAKVTRYVESHTNDPERRLLRLDLEGWEPQLELAPFVRFATAKRAAEVDVDASTLSGLYGAALASLAIDLKINEVFSEVPGTPAEIAPPDPEAEVTSRTTFLETLSEWSAERPLIIVAVDAVSTPESLRHATRSAALASEGRIVYIEGLDPASREASQEVPGTSADGTSADGTEGILDISEPVLDDVTAEKVQQMIDAAGADDVATRARQAMELLALLDATAPLEPLLMHLELDEAQREAVIDHVDDVWVDELAMAMDLEFLHPSFPQGVYRLHPAVARRLRHAADPTAIQRLFEFLRLRLDPHARGTTIVLRRLAAAVGAHEPAAHLERRLAWWGSAAADQELDAAVATGRLSSDTLRALARDAVWAPAARLRFLEAWKRTTGSESLGDVLIVEAGLHRELKDLESALRASSGALERALDESSEDHSLALLHARAIHGRLLLDNGDLVAAREQIDAARQLADELLPAEDPRHMALLSDFAELLMHSGELRAAKAPLAEALERATGLYGEAHPSTLSRRHNVAALMAQIGELEEAAAEHEAIGRLSASIFGPGSSFEINALLNLLLIIPRLGRSHTELLGRIRGIIAGLGGAQVGELIPALARLGDQLAHLESDAAARDTYELALLLMMEHGGADHPATAKLRSAIARLGA